MKVLYFGCLGDVGHYLWHRAGDYPRECRWQHYAKLTPWGNEIDGAVFVKDETTRIPVKSPNAYKAGHIHLKHKVGYTAVGWADYSIDSRPGSHSTFVAPEHVDAQILIAAARIQWPEVFGRERFPMLT